MSNVSPPVDQRETRGGSRAPNRWSVGTLTYTTGGLILLFCWLLWGDFAWSMKERSVGPVIQVLFKKFEASDMLVGLLLGSLPGALSLLISPIVSFKSDRCRSRWGRRIPFLLYSTPFVVLSMVGLAFSPSMGHALHNWLGDRSPGLNGATLLVFGLFWTLFELGTITANSVFGGLVNDVVPRPLLGRFYGMFRALSLMAGILFNFWLLQWAQTHSLWLFLGVGLLYGGGFTLMCLKVKEGNYPEPALAEQPPTAIETIRLYFRECFGMRYYLWIFALGTCAALAFTPVSSFGLYHALSLKMDMAAYGKCLAITYGISLVLAYPLGALADRFHPLRVGIVMLALYSGIMLWGGLFIDGIPSFTTGLVAHGVLSGAYMTAVASLAQALLPRDKFAQYASAWAIVGCLSGIVFTPAVGLLLDLSNHQYRYAFLTASLFAFLGLIAGLVVWNYFLKYGGANNYVAPQTRFL